MKLKAMLRPSPVLFSLPLFLELRRWQKSHDKPDAAGRARALRALRLGLVHYRG